MKAIIIAAGASTRLRHITDNLPKCMLKINGKPILQHTIEVLRNNNITDISVIKGYNKDKINYPDLTYFENNDFLDNNILHSLMHARAKLEETRDNKEDVIVSYSDIWYENSVIEKLKQSNHPISAVVDTDWESYYEGRTDHPIEEAENVIMDQNQHIIKIGKNVFTAETPKEKQGEFIGLWKFTPEGINAFLNHFDRINNALEKTSTFQNAKEWQKSCITDIFQELVNQGENVHCTIIQKGWKEFDTVQDFLKIGGILE